MIDEMIDKMFEMAQAEYQRQYHEWLRKKPSQDSILEYYERIKRSLEKHKAANTSKEEK